MVMYVTLDKKHVSHFHMVQHDRSVMYSLGDATLVHCIRPDGHYYQVRLGLDKSKDEVHGFYIEAGTFVAFESLGDSNAGFAQISFNFMAIGDNSLMMPNKNQLLQALPAPKNVIERLAIEG
ncbi:Sir2 silent information regulator family NAD-dependent deacetylase [Ligilactobacillus equi DPC 6820]|uniref:Sir2 silent information regulator family NAD-dependent deacetylase n=2 Tax=Ligilactobacillus equi TaxID=137357 RepID=V7HZZ8_9LACO|nr:Sir2 silent information regulator family NAD-dependent deacetylase [Ligilactobacillus equi DPC 6820]